MNQASWWCHLFYVTHRSTCYVIVTKVLKNHTHAQSVSLNFPLHLVNSKTAPHWWASHGALMMNPMALLVRWALLDLWIPADVHIFNAEKDSCALVDVSQSYKQENNTFIPFLNTEIKEKWDFCFYDGILTTWKLHFPSFGIAWQFSVCPQQPPHILLLIWSFSKLGQPTL